MERNGDFRNDLKSIQRLCNATLACIGRLMSTERKIDKLELSIHVYMDAMVEVDKILVSGGVNNDNGKSGQPNFVKSNCLGLLSAANHHEYFGPAAWNWEGD